MKSCEKQTQLSGFCPKESQAFMKQEAKHNTRNTKKVPCLLKYLKLNKHDAHGFAVSDTLTTAKFATLDSYRNFLSAQHSEVYVADTNIKQT